MGIKFRCPNGHKLNVKSFLAGKRGICPHCDAKFRIPAESGGEAQPVSKTEAASPATVAQPEAPVAATATAVAPQQAVREAMPAAAPSPTSNGQHAAGPAAARPVTGAASSPTSYAPQPTDPIAEAPQAVWYVRPAAGGEYGPAPGDVMRTWVSEGRVAADSLVWRESWPEWRRAAEVFPQLAAAGTSAAASTASAAVASVAPAGGALPIGTVGGPASSGGEFNLGGSASGTASGGRRPAARRRSNNTTGVIVAMLILLAILLAGVFAWVLTRRPASDDSYSQADGGSRCIELQRPVVSAIMGQG